MNRTKQNCIVANIKAIRLIRNPMYIVLTFVKRCLGGFKNQVMIVIFVNWLYHSVVNKRSFISAMCIIGIQAMVYLSITLFSEWYEHCYRPIQVTEISKSLMDKIFKKSISTNVTDFDNPEFYNECIWSIKEVEYGIIKLIDDIGNFLNNIIVSVSIIALLSYINRVVLISVLLSVLGTVLTYFVIIKISYRQKEELVPLKRKQDYFKRVFYMKQYAKEIRITKIASVLLRKFAENQLDYKKCLKRHGKVMFGLNVTNGLLISSLLDIGVMLILIYQLIVIKEISIGEFTAASYAIWSLFSGLNGLVFSAGCIPQNGLYMLKVFSFLNNITDDSKLIGREILSENKFRELSFEHVSFKYRGSNKFVLKDVNFEINRGERIAIVGTNGAGKSTLVSLILRLYVPTSGIIKVNGKNVTQYNIDDYRKNFGATFQHFNIYATTLGNNVAMDLKYNENSILSALEEISFFEELQGDVKLDSILTREFDDKGIVLSGGQNQRIAIARAFVSKDFVILDEPSSALDVIYEYKLNKLIMDNTEGKTLIIVSHRLSTTVDVDKIWVLNNGKIEENGSHQELMSCGGTYSYMFKIQADKYNRV